MKETISSKVDSEVIKAIKAKAKNDERSLSWMINKILKESIQNSK